MILDNLTEFADAQTVTATAISDVIDLGAAPALQDIGNGQPLYLVLTCDETAGSGGGSATVNFSLESDSTANLATSATTHASTGAIGQASLVAGTFKRVIPLPVEVRYERYLGVRFTVASGPLNAGKFSAFLTLDPHGWVALPDASS